MSTESTNGAVQGAAQGAAAGTAVLPGIGTAIGAVVGGILGLLGGKKKAAARRAKRQAAEINRQMAEREAAIQRRDIVRSLRVQRAQAISAGASEDGLGSSGVQGSVASLSAQGNFALGFFDRQVNAQNQSNALLKKADKYEGQAAAYGTAISSLGSLTSIGQSAYGLFRPASTGAGLQPYTPTGLGATRMSTTPTVGY